MGRKFVIAALNRFQALGRFPAGIVSRTGIKASLPQGLDRRIGKSAALRLRVGYHGALFPKVSASIRRRAESRPV